MQYSRAGHTKTLYAQSRLFKWNGILKDQLNSSIGHFVRLNLVIRGVLKISIKLFMMENNLNNQAHLSLLNLLEDRGRQL